ncbi:MAG: 2-C-methyl-D-erythritol 2,4-cyclodiphosphate synthase [Vampirovibrionales bacterium]
MSSLLTPTPIPEHVPTLLWALRVGQGQDIHRLSPYTQKTKPLILGGVLIPDAPYGLEGHSDGDALLHALVDAILGAMGLGDIGTWFSDKDPQWCGVNSMTLLEHVLSYCRTHYSGFTVLGMDSTIVLQSPSLKHHKADIQQRLATCLQLPLHRVGVKAKTAEHLGELGSGRAVLTFVTITLYVPEPHA